MKSTEAPPPAPSSSNRRSQPVRQTRTNPPRNPSALSCPFAGRESMASAPAHDQPIDIFPAVTHVADIVTTLPKELIRHFTLLKEVEAKIHAPELALFDLVKASLDSPVPDTARSVNDAASSIAPGSAPMSAQNSSTGLALNGQLPLAPSTDGSLHAAAFDPNNLPRRQLFRQTAFKIQEMLMSLEEKNHVISAGNEALNKQLGRLEDVWPYLEAEFSDEAKWGSTTHWAYPENRIARANHNQAERSRREGAASLSAAAQALAEEAAARSDARKQAVAAKKNKTQNQPQESDFDDRDGKHHRAEPAKKSSGGKSRKTPADSPAAVGLGITNAASNGNPAPKRRKVEKPSNGGTPTEKAIATVPITNAPKMKIASPREPPLDGQPKKRKALPTSTGQSKKSKPSSGPAASPTVGASSPLIGAVPNSSKVARESPVPVAATSVRPASSRARQNSIQSTAEHGRQRAASFASVKPNGAVSTPPEPAAANIGARATNESKITKDAPPIPKPEAPKAEPEVPAPTPATFSNGGKKEGSVKKDEAEGNKEVTSTVVAATTPTTAIMTKSGRASKPSTPALATFAEAAASRARPSRNPESGNSSSNNTISTSGNASGNGNLASSNNTSIITTTAKRSHKKGASSAAAQALAARLANESNNSSVQGEEDEMEVDEDEPRYCYCNSVSYGEMVACDADDCPREWFHLECVGLKVAPKGNAKWYCDDCKERLKNAGKKINGR